MEFVPRIRVLLNEGLFVLGNGTGKCSNFHSFSGEKYLHCDTNDIHHIPYIHKYPDLQIV